MSAILVQLAEGQTIEQVLADYPQLEREDVLAVLKYVLPRAFGGDAEHREVGRDLTDVVQVGAQSEPE